MNEAIALASKLIGLAIDLVGKETVRQLIDQQTVETADAVADAIEVARFGKTSHDK